jgi:signal transduction histidine kinase
MAEIIDALLEFARAGARPQPGVCDDVARVIQEVVVESQSLASGSEIEFVSEAISPAAVGCSRGVLGIVIANLVRNAVKYIDGGSNGVRRITLRVNELERALRFEVEDTGPGLPPGAEETVFEPFVRFSTKASGGIGLGLATVKRLVEAHNGKVGVVSTPGRGCRFWFELPQPPRPGTSLTTRSAKIPPATPVGRSTQDMPPS